ncbi:M48 family metallopeptidase [Patescibacteria group bacterium]|nr:M48 family metallopeptidase [Patescibacteria group bacterium]
MAGFFVFVIAVGWIFSQALQSPGILYFAVLFSVIMNITSYWYSDKIALAINGAKPVAEKDNPELYRIVENLAITAGLPSPKIYIIQDASPNAFATGRDKYHAAVAVTSGLLERLDRTELEAVLSHELSHIGNRDTLVSTVVVVLAGLVALLSNWFLRWSFWGGMSRRSNDEGDSGQIQAIFMLVGLIFAILAPLVATLIQLAVSRRREFLADASGVLLTRYPDGLISALKKIASDPSPMRSANTATAHLYFENPFKADSGKGQRIPWLVKLFMTHPPVEERINALRQKI